jgi:hypothetical protein
MVWRYRLRYADAVSLLVKFRVIYQLKGKEDLARR